MSVTSRCPTCGAITVIPGTSGTIVMTCQKCRSASVTVTPGGAEAESEFNRVWIGDPAAETIAERPAPAPAPPRASGPTISVTPSAPVKAPAPSPEKRAALSASGSDVLWIHAENERFRQFVAQEWEKLKRGRVMLVEMEAQTQMAFSARQMEANRLEVQLGTRQAELDREQRELQAKRDDLAAREAEVARLAGGLSAREESLRELESRRDELRKEVADLARLASDLRPVVEQLRSRQGELTATRAELAEKQAVLDRRFVEVGRGEVALHGRQAELDEWQATLREEFDARERELAQQRAALNEQLKTAHRERGPTSTGELSIG